eukprot:1458169-Pleurochrysis_carterae.AAC.2
MAKRSRPCSAQELKEECVDGATIACGRMVQEARKRKPRTQDAGLQRKLTSAKGAWAGGMVLKNGPESMEMPLIRSHSSIQAPSDHFLI